MTQDQDTPATEAAPAPIPWDYAQAVAHPRQEPVDRAEVLRAFALTLGAFLAAGLVAGLAWSQLADPADFMVSRAGAFMDETAAGEQFGVEVTFALIAVVLSLLVSVLLTIRLHRTGWYLAVALVVGALLAAVVQWQLGVALGPPEPDSVLALAVPGDLVESRLAVEAKGLLLVWPIVALVALLGYVGVHRESASSGPSSN